MLSCWKAIFITTLIVSISDVKSETTAYPEIPKHLLECYIKDGIYHRANRVPSSYDSFLDLLRKIESSPTGRNINARELSLVLLHYLKMDGIISVQSQARTSSNILPFAPSGDEYFKHRLTLIGLVAKIDQSYLAAINESLTKKEMCNLHFMLSYSVDPYKRENERCSPLYDDIKSENYGESRAEWNPYQGAPGFYHRALRHKRDPKHRHARKTLHSKATLIEERDHQSSWRNSLKRAKNQKSHKRRAKRNEEKAEVEIIAVSRPQHFAEPIPKVTERDKFTIGNNELLSENEQKPKGMQSLNQIRVSSSRYGNRPSYTRTGYGTDDGSPFAGFLPGMQLSDCPSVNGIITSPFGSLSIGTVMAGANTGIAAGLNPEDIHPTKLSVNPSELENPMDRVNNVWATTLAGTVANTISSSALLEMDNFQVLKGGWNESTSPRWYLLKNNQQSHVTEVSLRGSLDGLFLGLTAKELSNKFSNLKLSQLLQIYYEYTWGEVGAKNRVMMRPQYAPDEIFRQQVHLMSLVLKRQKMNVITVLNYDIIAKEAVSRVSNFIQNMDDRNNPNRPAGNKVDVAVNMVTVIDPSWGHENLLKIFEALRTAQVAATPFQSNLTIVCGNDGKIMMNAQNILDVSLFFTREMLFENCSRGMNFLEVFDSLEFFYRKLYQHEETKNKVNTDAQVLAFFPYDAFLQDNNDVTYYRSKEFQHIFPDVRLVIAANGRSDAFETLVKTQKNLFAIVPSTVDPDSKSIKDFADAIKLSHQRISRPSCGSYFDDDSQSSEVRMMKDISPGEIVYFRLLPNYYFISRGEVAVTIRSKQRAPITVCHSREVEKPEDLNMRRSMPTNRPNSNYDRNYNRNYNYKREYLSEQTSYSEYGPVQCKTITSDTYRIEMQDPCYSAYTLDECLPLYISLQSHEQSSSSIMCPTCRMPFNVQAEISAYGLTCYNGTAYLLANPFALFASLLVSVFFALFNLNLA